jgi:hypothetical protein
MFLLIKYDDEWWIQNFKMSKDTFFNIANKPKPLITKKDTIYHFLTLMEVQVACMIFTSCHMVQTYWLQWIIFHQEINCHIGYMGGC